MIGAGLVSVAPFAVAAGDSVSAPSQVDSNIAKTADLSQFRPGNIVSDAVFFDSSTLSEAQIQSFLESKVSSCRSGYTCLKDYYVQTRSIAADPMCGAYSGGGMERASRVIYKVAQACGINPQVIIVMLQKEQGLITSTAPSSWAYQAAMGQGCPDTAACDTAYYGLFNQVYGGARQMKRYANPPGTSNYFTWYAPGNTWNVLYHPNSACGRSPVYIENQATANLYYYTPYQPNAAALRAGYGEGDGCSSYGNRNFFNYFTDWFGSTQVPNRPFFTSLDSGSFIVALDDAGSLWAYPFSKSRWGARVEVSVGVEDLARILPVGDFTGDRSRDYVGVTAAGSVWLLVGDGSSLAAGTSLGVDWADAVAVTAAGDFDGDGIADVFTTDSEGRLFLWRGSGTGTFRKPIQVGQGWAGMDYLSGGQDLSGDGKPDLIARDSEGVLWLYTGNGAGSWGPRLKLGEGWGSMTAIFVPGDFTGDGAADLFARSSDGVLSLYRGTGGGAVTSVGRYGAGWQVMTAITDAGLAPGALRAPEPGVGDLNGDGNPDVVGLTNAGELRAYWGNGAGGWRQGWRQLADDWAGDDRVIALGDFTGDGEPDIARITASGDFLLYGGEGRDELAEPEVIGQGWDVMDLVIGGSDFDGDGFRDVLARNDAGRLVLYRGNGLGGWMSEARPIVGQGWETMDSVFYAGDFDGDGAGDLMARRVQDGSLWLYPRSRSNTWLAPRQVGWSWEPMTAIFSPGDFDGSGTSDVMARSADGTLLLYRGNGRGGWAGAVAVGTRWDIMSQIE